MPTSIAITAALIISRSLIRSPARLMIATRSRQGVAAQAGWAARAAATASSTFAAVAFAKVPNTIEVSIGVRTSNDPSPSRHVPPM